MLLEVINQTIVASEEEISQVSPVRIAADAALCFLRIEVHQFPGEQVTAVHMLFAMRRASFAGTRVFPYVGGP